MQTIKILPAAITDKQAIIALLQKNKLPIEDLPPVLDNFFVAIADDCIVGVIGLELHGEFGLLRSLAVDATYRNQQIALALITAIELKAKQLQLESIYLLTETAKGYFEKKGYAVIARADVSEAIKQSSEFSHVCPVSAVVMQKQIS